LAHFDLTQLRIRAEQEALALESQETNPQWPAEARRVLHELRVHQIELEMQNEELRVTRDQLETSKARYFDLYDLAPVGYFTLSEQGLILEANLTAATLLGVARSELPKQRLSQFILKHYRDIYYSLRQNLFTTGQPQACELRLTRKGGEPFWARLEAAVGPGEGGALDWRVVAHDITDRKRAEELRSHLAAIVESSDDAIIGKTLEGTILSWNSGAETLYGYKAEEMVGQPISRLAPSDRPYEIPQILERLQHGERIVHYETERIRKDGRRIEASLTMSPIHDSTGSIVGASVIARDITEQRQAEAVLRESEQRFRNMADAAPVMIWVAGPDKLFTFLNKTWLDFTGRTMEQELANGWVSGVHPEDRDRYNEAFCSSFNARRSFQIECRLRRADGEFRWMLCTGVPRFDPAGVFAGYIGSDIDITNLQSEERFRQLAENIDQVFWMVDLGTKRFLYVSPAFEKVWGCSSADLYRNRNWLAETVHPEDRDHFLAFREKQISETAEELYRIVRPDGSIRWVYDRGFPIRDAEGKLYRVAGIAEDVTAHREMEEQLCQAKMEAVGRLAGGIAHDFNNLLTIIGGYSQMLLDGTPTEDSRRERLEQIVSAANRAGALTKQLLAFSRQHLVEPKLVNINHLLTNMEALLRRIMGESITIETSLLSEVGYIRVDPHQLEQVVMNLAANARDAMPNGGLFRIETTMAEAAEMQTEGSLGGPGKCVELRISDSGCGMDKLTLERAFEPFFTTKGVGKGTGLGLSTVYGIVRQNQGTISVNSKPGQGTVFELRFPTAEGEVETELPMNLPLKTAATETVLLVEDEPAVRGLVREALEQFGYAVLEAADGYEALRVIEHQKSMIHLLLTDVIMPLMNGHELAMRVKSMRPDIKVIYMSGYTDDTLAFHGITQTEIDVIQKPFTQSELREKLQAVLAAEKRRHVRSSNAA
jgi:PAS domain S-box-containing protein